MTLNIGYGETVDYVRRLPGVENAHGVVVDVWSEPVEIKGVGVDVPSTTETGPAAAGGGMDRQVVDLVLFCPPGFSCSKMDKFRVRGLVYQVVGDAVAVRNFFTGAVFPTPVNLRRIDG